MQNKILKRILKIVTILVILTLVLLISFYGYTKFFLIKQNNNI